MSILKTNETGYYRKCLKLMISLDFESVSATMQKEIIILMNGRKYAFLKDM